MWAGQYNEVVKIYDIHETINEYGEREEERKFQRSTRAHIERASGNRNVENDEIVYNHTKTFHLHSYIELQDTSQIGFNQKYYRILSIEPRREYNDIEVITEEINE